MHYPFPDLNRSLRFSEICSCSHIVKPVHNRTGPSPSPPCGRSRTMKACGCRGPAGSWSTGPAGRPGRGRGGRRRPGRCAAHCPRHPVRGGRCCYPPQHCQGGRSWPGTEGTRSQVWEHRSSSTGPEGTAYTLTWGWACWEEGRRRKGRCSSRVVRKENQLETFKDVL